MWMGNSTYIPRSTTAASYKLWVRIARGGVRFFNHRVPEDLVGGRTNAQFSRPFPACGLSFWRPLCRFPSWRRGSRPPTREATSRPASLGPQEPMASIPAIPGETAVTVALRRFGGERRPLQFGDRNGRRGRIRRDRLRQRRRGSRRRWRPGDIRRDDLCRRCLHHRGSRREWRRGRFGRLRGRNGFRRNWRGGRQGYRLELSDEHGRRRRFHGPRCGDGHGRRRRPELLDRGNRRRWRDHCGGRGESFRSSVGDFVSRRKLSML